jgi:hypothetical protein
MNNLETRRYEMFMRVRDFGVSRAASFPANTLGGEQFAIVAEVVEALTREATAQTSGVSSVQQATVTRAAARASLRESLQDIARTARAMALDTPGLENKFRMPRSGADQALLNAARVFAAEAAPLKSEFIRHELPAGFLEDLQSDITALEQSIGSQNSNRDSHITATASIEATMERGANAVQKLDAVVRNKFRDDPSTLAAWESARHVERVTRTARRSNGVSPTPTGEAKPEGQTAD